MNTATYIKEVNNTPVLFNVDNARDVENLEALQAIKMPENMANEIFGNNIRYADNTTCIITENSGNAEFPFNVRFDSSKVPAKPQTQRELTNSFLAGMGMPNGRAINVGVKPSGYVYTAPYSGYLYARGISLGNGLILLQGGGLEVDSFFSSVNHGFNAVLPIRKGQSVKIIYNNANLSFVHLVLAEGEI